MVTKRVYRRQAGMGFTKVAAFVLVFGLGQPAHAAWETQTLTAVTRDQALPELFLGVSFDRSQKRATISREWVQTVDGQLKALDVKELDFSANTQRLLLELRVGIYHHLEFHAIAPIVLQDDTEISFADGVEGNSTIFGSLNANDPDFDYRFPITQVPASRKRSGFGDMTFGLSWSPFVDKKDESYPTLTLRGDIIAPTGKTRDPVEQAALPGGSGGHVGLGQTTFDVSVALSKRTSPNTPALDPYITFGARIPVATSKQRGRGMKPPASGRFTIGSELIFHEEEESHQRYALDLSFGVRYVGIGRTYSELSDYLPNFDQTRVPGSRGQNPAFGPEIVNYEDYNNPNNYNANIDGAQCGILANVPCGELNRVDEHLEMQGSLAFHIQPAKYALIRAGVSLAMVNDHLLTAERVGTDEDPASAQGQICEDAPCIGRVNARNSQGNDERSPYYDPRYDEPGRRFIIKNTTNFTVFVTAAAQF